MNYFTLLGYFAFTALASAAPQDTGKPVTTGAYAPKQTALKEPFYLSFLSKAENRAVRSGSELLGDYETPVDDCYFPDEYKDKDYKCVAKLKFTTDPSETYMNLAVDGILFEEEKPHVCHAWIAPAAVGRDAAWIMDEGEVVEGVNMAKTIAKDEADKDKAQILCSAA